MPEHIVHDQHPARPQLIGDDRQRIGVAILVDVVKDQVERPGSSSQTT
jgi:hypothetical protein